MEMSEPIKLRYGTQTLSLSKSDRLIGLKPRPGRESAMARAIIAYPTARAAQSDNGREMLGGFEIIEAGSTIEEAEKSLNQLRQDPAVQSGTHVFHTSDDDVPF